MNSDPEIICGPIIGRVTSTTARILIELKYDATLTINLTPADSKLSKKFQKSKELIAKTPTVFEFKSLTPECLYKISFQEKIKMGKGVPEITKCQFRTLPSRSKNLKFAVVSCNAISPELTRAPEFSLWKNLAERIDEVDYVFHGGDQVYLDENAWLDTDNKDNAYMICKELYEKKPNFADYAEDIRNIMREFYRKTFNYPHIAHVHRNAPNMMIMDDHEICDDFGFREEYLDKTNFHHFYAEQARYVYYQYQRQLRENIDFTDFNKIGGEYFVDNIAGVGAFFVDYRGCRTWQKVDGDKYKLGTKQWEELEKCFGINGTFSQSDVKTVLFFSSTVVVYLPDTVLTRLAGSYENDCYEQWAVDLPQEQRKLLKLLIDFKLNTGKEVAIVTGDIHIRGFTDIKLNGHTCLRQIVTSGVSTWAPTPFQEYFLKQFISLTEDLGDGLTFIHHDFGGYNNYAFLDLELNESKKYDIWATHVEALDRDKVTPRDLPRMSMNCKIDKDTITKPSTEGTGAGGCSIF
jgi:hypothetical protein